MSERVLVILQDRNSANLGGIAEPDRYLVRREPDGTLIWEPVEGVSVAERAMLADGEVQRVIDANRNDPGRLQTHDRSALARS